MDLQNKYHDLIEDYLDGKLSEKEEKDFHQKVQNDSNLSEALRERQKLREYWTLSKKYENTKDFVISSLSENPNIPFYKNRIFLAAASILILIGVAWLIWFGGPDYNSDNSQMQADMIDSGKDESVLLHDLELNKLNEKADIDSLFKENEKVKLISPAEWKEYQSNDTIIFTGVIKYDRLVNIEIRKLSNDSLIKSLQTFSENNFFMIEISGLPIGEYYWRLNRFKKKAFFNIIKDHHGKD